MSHVCKGHNSGVSVGVADLDRPLTKPRQNRYQRCPLYRQSIQLPPFDVRRAFVLFECQSPRIDMNYIPGWSKHQEWWAFFLSFLNSIFILDANPWARIRSIRSFSSHSQSIASISHPLLSHASERLFGGKLLCIQLSTRKKMQSSWLDPDSRRDWKSRRPFTDMFM